MKSLCAPSPVYPSVTIGLPVYNGIAYLEEALKSLVIQDYPNLEILASDNLSTDGSWELLCEYALTDDRIRLFRHPKNVGALGNFQSTLFQTDATYFMWAAHDDIWQEGFVSAAVEVLESHPDVVMVNALTQIIDEKGGLLPLPATRPQLCELRTLTYAQRVTELARRVGWCVYGLTRRDALLQTCIMGDDLDVTFDVVTTYELAAMGSFAVLDQFQFCYRILPKTVAQSAAALGLPTGLAANTFSRMFLSCLRAIQLSLVDFEEKKAALAGFIQECAVHQEWNFNLSSENGWPVDAPVEQKIALLKALS